MGNGKPTRCPICREQMSSGKALGGHMSRHKAARQRRAATLAAKASPEKATKGQKCKICGESMKGGRANGGHMSKHRRAERVQTVPTFTPDHRAAFAAATQKGADVTASFGPAMERTLKIVDSLRSEAKRKRGEAAKLEAQSMVLVKTKRDEANELDRLAERVGHIL